MVRVGWSIPSLEFQLGESPYSFGYQSNGRCCCDSQFVDYGEPYGVGDIITSYLVGFQLCEYKITCLILVIYIWLVLQIDKGAFRHQLVIEVLYLVLITVICSFVSAYGVTQDSS